MANTATQLLLTRVDHESKMVSVMRNLFSSGLLTDVTLSCEGQVIHAHRLVLASVSTYFESIFQSPLVSNQPNPVVILKDMKLSDLKAIIEFVYSGEVRVQENQLESLVKSAETLDISGLSRICPNPMSHLQQTRSSKSLSPTVSPILEPPILREERTNNQALVNKLSVSNEVPFKDKNNVCNIESDPAAGLKYKYQFHPDSSSSQSHESNSTCASSVPAEDYADLTDAVTIAKRNAKRAKRSVTSGNASEKDILTGIKQSLPISKINDRSEQLTSSPSLRPRSPEIATPTPAPRYKKTSTSSDVPESHQTTRSQTRIPFGKLVLIQKGDVPVSKEFPLHYKDFTIGRDPSCHLKICDSLVSDTHCVISYDGLSEPKLINRAKATILNGQLMVSQATLKTGDIIEIADRKLRFEFTPQIQSPQKPPSYANGSSNLLTTKSEDDMLAAASNRMSIESNKQASKSSQDLDVKPIVSKHNTIETEKHVQRASTSFEPDGSFSQEPPSNSQSSTSFTRLKHPEGTSSSGRLRPRRHMRKNLRRVCAERDRRNRMRLNQMG